MKKLIVLALLSVSLFSCKKEEIKPTYEIGSEYGGGTIIGIKFYGNTVQDPNNPNGIGWVSKRVQLIIGVVDKKEIAIYPHEPQYEYAYAYALLYCNGLTTNGYDDWTLGTDQMMSCAFQTTDPMYGNAYYGYDASTNTEIQLITNSAKCQQFSANNYSTNKFWGYYDDMSGVDNGGGLVPNGSSDNDGNYIPYVLNNSVIANVIPVRYVDIPVDEYIK
jgi:hypothetical protein